MKCPKCDGEMEEGVLGQNYKYLVLDPSFVSKTISFLNLKKGLFGRILPNTFKVIRHYRCKNCGYLENYAK